MKRIARFSVENPVTVLMLVLGVLLLGYISFSSLGMDLFPDIDNPRLFVEIAVGERPPEEIEETIVEALESLAVRQRNVLNVSSVTRVGAARIVVEYAWGTDMDLAFLDLQKALSPVGDSNDVDELTVSQHDPNSSPVIVIAFSRPGTDDMAELNRIAENYLQNELIRLEGIADVELLGGEEKEVVVETDAYLLEAFGITAADVASAISSYNRDISGGTIVEKGTQYVIKGVGAFTALDDIRRVVVTYRDPDDITAALTGVIGGRVPVFLDDLADVRIRNGEPDTIARLDGERCMALAVYKEMHYNTVSAVDTFMTELETLRTALPGYKLIVVQNSGEFIITAIDEVRKTAMIGILLAIGVLFLFLRRLGPTAVISVAIPVSIVATFTLMYFADLTLNIMTLGGLALGAGMLVDNAIVVMENIFRNMESGKSVREAAVEGTGQVGGAITASTITTIIVFLPIVYLKGTAGALFRDQAITVAFSLLASLVVAVLVIPMLVTVLIRKPGATGSADRTIGFPRYGAFLSRALSMRWWVILGAAVLVVAALRLIPVIGSEFIPRTDTREYTLDLRLPEGTELVRTSEVTRDIEDHITGMLAGGGTVFSVTGPSGDVVGGADALYEDENTATIMVTLDPELPVNVEDAIAGTSAKVETVPDLSAAFSRGQTAIELTMGATEAPVVVEFQGSDLDTLEELAEQASVLLAANPDLANVETGFKEGRPELNIVFDRVRAGLNGVGIDAVVSQVSNRLEGADAGDWESGGEQLDIVVELPRLTTRDVADIEIRSGGRDFLLSDIADMSITDAPREIVRTNQVRVGVVTADIATDTPLAHVVASIDDVISGIDIPADYRYDIGGEERNRREAFGMLGFALMLSVVLVYMVLAAQFESLVHPFTILLSIPLAGVGAIVTFFILGRPLNIMAYIGIIMLVGIAVNDSIILVDAIIRLMREGLGRTEAIIEAGRRRIRPIIMTSMTTILALTPLTIGFGEGASLRSPMAYAVIGGLVSSTLLTLVVIPCVFSVLDMLRPGSTEAARR
jgi:hydrophobic/amphiphilic exporter-1 (mainly G- bacteria), HAE1 family